jgi:hypothetical protein
MPKKLTEEIINAAIDGFKAQKSRLDDQIAERRTMLNGGSPQGVAAPETTPPRKRRKMRAAARRRIAIAQRARWARLRGESKPGRAKVKALKPKRRISPEGLKRIIAATKKRWRLQRATMKATSAKVAKRKAA